MTQPNTHYDICIIGGGLVGLTLAALLAKQTPLTIAIVESQQPELQWNSPFDLRVSAINRASERIWRFIQVWDTMLQCGVSAYQHMTVWDEVSSGNIEFDAVDVAEPNLGYIVEHRVAIKTLFQHLETQKAVKFFCPAKSQTLQHQNDIFTVELDHETISAKLLIGADGAHSWLRQQLNIAMDMQSYGHNALVTTIRSEKPHQQTAWQCFLADGPVALLPFSDAHYCSMVWSIVPERAQALQNMSAAEFNQTISAVFFEQLGQLEKTSAFIHFPLYKRHVKHYVQAQAALVGDAAHTIHPLAGQGVNLGLLDAAVLAEVIATALQQQRPFYSLETLRRYERWRKSNNYDMLTAMDIFKQLFSSSQTLLQPLRRLGLSTVNKTAFVKRFFIRRALGIQGDLPAICYEK